MKKSSKNRLVPQHQDLFRTDSLFDRIARAVCRAGTLPRKELHEAWETARRIRRHFRGGRVVDLACGHGLMAHIMLLLDNSSPEALAVDTGIPPNAGVLSEAITASWPRLENRVRYIKEDLSNIEITPDDLVVSVHACGSITDQVLKRAVESGARVAVLPCCHDAKQCDTLGLEAWMDVSLAIDTARVLYLRQNGYRTLTKTIPFDITPKNRLLMGEPLS